MYGPKYGAWRAPRRAPCRRKACKTVARSLKMKADGVAYTDEGKGGSFQMWTQSEREVADIGACGG